MTYSITVNGQAALGERRCGHAAALGAARSARPEGHEVRLRHGALRRLHRSSGRRADAVLHRADLKVGAAAVTTIEGVGATAIGGRSRTPGSTSTWCNAAIARRARSCRRAALLANNAAPDRRRHRPRDGRQRLPLLRPIRASARPSSRPPACRPPNGDGMTSHADAPAPRRHHGLRRRMFLKAGAAVGGGLLLELSCRPRARAAVRRRARPRPGAQRLRPHRARRPRHHHVEEPRDRSGHQDHAADADRRGTRRRLEDVRIEQA